MAPENAHIFYVEDDESVIKVRTIYLKNAGHVVDEVARTLDEALTKIPMLNSDINVAVVDGNLEEQYTRNGEDGEIVAMELKKQRPDITIIGNASDVLLQSADINCKKIEGAAKLAEVVTNA